MTQQETDGGLELPDDWWTTEDVAAYLGVTTSTLRAYLARKQMPQPDRRLGRMTLWRPSSIREWRSTPGSDVRLSDG